MKKNNINYSSIFHQENYMDDGEVVFYDVPSPNSIGIGYLKYSPSSGWNWINGIEQQMVFDDYNDKMTWFWSHNLKTINNNSGNNYLPVFMGLVRDQNIKKVIVKSVMGTTFSPKQGISIKAKIIPYHGARIWYLIEPNEEILMLGKGPTEILGESERGDILYSNETLPTTVRQRAD